MFIFLHKAGVFFQIPVKASALMIGYRKLQALELPFHLRKMRKALLCFFKHGAAALEVVLLAQISYVEAVPYVQVARRRFYVSGYDPEQRRLSGAVRADYAYAVAFFNAKTDILENDVCSIRFAYVFARDYYHGLKLQSRHSIEIECRFFSRFVCVVSR